MAQWGALFHRHSDCVGALALGFVVRAVVHNQPERGQEGDIQLHTMELYLVLEGCCKIDGRVVWPVVHY